MKFALLATLYLTFGTVSTVWEGGLVSDDIASINIEGEEYYVDGIDDFRVGDSVYVLMDDMGTPEDPTDDEILDIHLMP